MKRILACLSLLACLITGSAFAAGDPGPFGTDVFVRGGFNGWSTDDQMTWDDSAQQFDAILTLDVGTYEFKIADATWSNPDFGPTGDANVTLGMTTDIGTAIGANFMIEITQAGDYVFSLFNIAPDLSSGTLLVSAAVPLPGALVLLFSGLVGLGFRRRR